MTGTSVVYKKAAAKNVLSAGSEETEGYYGPDRWLKKREMVK